MHPAYSKKNAHESSVYLFLDYSSYRNLTAIRNYDVFHFTAFYGYNNNWHRVFSSRTWTSEELCIGEPNLSNYIKVNFILAYLFILLVIIGFPLSGLSSAVIPECALTPEFKGSIPIALFRIGYQNNRCISNPDSSVCQRPLIGLEPKSSQTAYLMLYFLSRFEVDNLLREVSQEPI